MKLFSQDDIKNIYDLTLAESGLDSMEMIETVGNEVADELAQRFDTSTPVIIFAGYDGCGDYALAAGISLLHKGYTPYVFLFNIGGDRLSAACQQLRDSFCALSPEPALTEVTGMKFTMPELDSGMVVIDGLFGSSISGALSRGYQILVTNINESGAFVISIDTPSGLPANPMSGLVNSKIIHAALTLTPVMPRLSFFINENIELVGQWRIVGPRPSEATIRRTRSTHFLVENTNIARCLKPRPCDSSKSDYGSAIIFAGSYGMMGAAVLAATAASRSGCGKVTCHAPRCGCTVLQTSVPSALFEADCDDTNITEIRLIHNYSSVAIGCGLGTDDRTISALEAFLKIASANNRPVILDADALNCIAIRPSILDYLPVLSVITPHAGEFDRLFGVQPSSSARLAKAIEIARTYRIIIVLKGYYTATIRPDGKVFYNSSGTPALATAGSGDVLTGLMAGLMAQGLKPEIASIAAVYIHGVAGRMAQETHGSYGVTAGDIADRIGMAIKSVMDE